MKNKDYRTSKYLKVIIVIFLKQPWHTLIFTLCISCPLDFIERVLTPESYLGGPKTRKDSFGTYSHKYKETA